ncbi:MAG: flagellar filament outer layer protein FlaA [Spirochaetales bacterium]|nr:flagellar filament outer layer protein FlaA [Spirochaetales bacterium]
MMLKGWGLKTLIFLLFFAFIPNIVALDLIDEEVIESKLLDDFDSGLLDRWIVKGSKFVTKDLLSIAEVKAYPDRLFGKNREGTDLKCLGARVGFDRHGYNYLEIIPASEAAPDTPDQEIIYTDPKSGKKYVSSPIIFPGIAKELSVWVWGANYNYYMEAHVQDYNGIVHILHMGELTFYGWKNMVVSIPPGIPQTEKYLPRREDVKLKLIKFMVWTRPTERVKYFYIYIDQLKCLTNIFEGGFDGDDLADEGFVQETWGSN